VFIAVTSIGVEYGGPAVSVVGLAAGLAKQGCDVTLWSLKPSDDAQPPAGGYRTVFGSVKDALSRYGKPDIVHDNGIWLPHNHLISRYAGKNGIHRIVSPRGMLAPWAVRHKPLKKKLAWLLYQRQDLFAADCLHATAAEEGEHLEALNSGRPVKVLPNGIEPDGLYPTPSLTSLPLVPGSTFRTALFLGRLYPVKGLPNLLAVWGAIRPGGWRLVIAGPDEAGHRAELEAQVRGLSLQNDIEFVGPIERNRKSALLRSADLFVLPSLSESFGMALAEAMLAGLPVVTTNAVPWPDIEPEGLGWRVQPTKDSLAKALFEATSTAPDTLKIMGQKARDYVATRYMWDSLAPKYVELYEENLANRR
jgi:glycosyltransferase involved in cell wall biosynthesis